MVNALRYIVLAVVIATACARRPPAMPERPPLSGLPAAAPSGTRSSGCSTRVEGVMRVAIRQANAPVDSLLRTRRGAVAVLVRKAAAPQQSVPHATVFIQSDTGTDRPRAVIRVATTDSVGRVLLADTPPGEYSFQARRIGFIRFESKVYVRVGYVDTINVALPEQFICLSASVGRYLTDVAADKRSY